MLKNFLKKILKNKIIFGAIPVMAIGGYFGLTAITDVSAETRYVLSAVEKGTLITSVSGTGQVAASSQVDIKPKVSGDVVYVAVKSGQEVKAGALLFQIDSRDAQKTVSDAATSLETAELELEDLLAPADELTMLQSEDSLAQAEETEQKAKDNLTKSYEDGFNSVADAFYDLPDIMTDLENILYGNNVDKSQDNISAYTDLLNIYDSTVTEFATTAAKSYETARLAYDKNLQNYKLTGRYSGTSTIEDLISESYVTTKSIAEAIKDADNLISIVKDTLTGKSLAAPVIIATQQSAIKTDTGKINGLVSDLSSAKTSIKSYQNAIISAGRSTKQKELSLAKLEAGADSLTVRAKKISVQAKADAVDSAKDKLADYYVRAPFDGVIAKVDIKKGDSASSGSAAVTIITKQQIVEISLNEVDISKVKAGQKATLTFDAVSDLSITGEVVEVDAIGTTSQGVVSYDATITFDTQDERIKSGMSVSAAIITDMELDVLMVPNAAVKILGSSYYVEIPNDGAASSTLAASSSTGVVLKNSPGRQQVEIGLANDSCTEIVSGLKEGDIIVTRTIDSSSTKSTKTTQSATKTTGGSGMMMFGR